MEEKITKALLAIRNLLDISCKDELTNAHRFFGEDTDYFAMTKADMIKQFNEEDSETHQDNQNREELI